MSHKTKVKLEVLLPDSPIDLINIGMALLGLAHTAKNPALNEFAEDLFQAIAKPLDAEKQAWGGKLYSMEVKEAYDRWMNDRPNGFRDVMRMASDRLNSLPPDETNEPKPT